MDEEVSSETVGRRELLIATAAAVGAGLAGCATSSTPGKLPNLPPLSTDHRKKVWEESHAEMEQMRADFQANAVDQKLLLDHIAQGLARVGVDLKPFVEASRQKAERRELEQNQWLEKHIATRKSR